MNILNLKVLRGPNIWSNYRQKLIQIKLDLKQFESLPTDQLQDFNQNLKHLMPSLETHHCSPGVPGGFFIRLERGTWLGHVVEHVALELQNLAGMNCGFGRTYTTDEVGVYQVVFSYEIEEAGIYAAEAAVNLVNALANQQPYPNLKEDLFHLSQIYARYKFGPSTQAIIDEANKRKIPWMRFKDSAYVTLGFGCQQKKIWATVSSNTRAIGVDIATNKAITKAILEEHFIPVPQGYTLSDIDELEDVVDRLGFPLVIKPLDANHGRGIITNIQTKEKAWQAFKIAHEISYKVIVERYITGEDYRFLVVNHKVIAVAKRTPAMIIGDGLHTVHELIDITNLDPKRGQYHDSHLTRIAIDNELMSCLLEKNLTLDSVLAENEMIFVKNAANLSSGGTASDVTSLVHPFNKTLAERISRIIQLDICGIDIILKSVQEPLTSDNGAVLEVNASPGLRMHLAPNEGKGRNVAGPILDMLYPKDTNPRIPVIAVTGTNGKTTVVRLIAALLKANKHCVGFTTTEGIYVNDQLVYAGDCSGPLSASAVLREPNIDFAVLECARGGILRNGLGFDVCDISILTNVAEDHLGQDEINTLEQLAHVKGVVLHSTKSNGYAILNAEDDLVYQFKEDLDCQVALFGLRNNDRINKHCREGGLACYVEENDLIIQQGKIKQPVFAIKDIPITLNGQARCMIKNLLPAVLAAFISKVDLSQIKQALLHFELSIDMLPGRMNVFDFNDVKLIIDYAHNPDALLELKPFFEHKKYNKKIGILAGSGDRRSEDLIKLGAVAGTLFDEIIIRHNKDTRGRANEEISRLITFGIKSTYKNCPIKIISDGFQALEEVFSYVSGKSLIFYTIDEVLETIDYLTAQKSQLLLKLKKKEKIVL